MGALLPSVTDRVPIPVIFQPVPGPAIPWLVQARLGAGRQVPQLQGDGDEGVCSGYSGVLGHRVQGYSGESSGPSPSPFGAIPQVPPIDRLLG